jgi:hypothetical protein
MKRNYKLLLLFLLVTVSILAQTPEKMSYQVVLRDASNTLLMNQQVGIQISILQTTITGVAVYTETQTATTNINGLVSLEIGSGTSLNNFSAIDWSAGPYFIKTATDASGGSNYTIIGTSQLMSVPFALYAKTAAAGALTGTSLNSTVVGSSLTSIGTLTDLTVTGTAETGFVKITGGSPAVGNVLTSDADGLASWSAAAISVTEVDDEFTATTSQTAFTLSQVPSANSKVKMYVNGIRISKTAYAYTPSGTSLTYVPANNGGYALTAGDRIQFDYFY